jgi:hypothetical protein
VSIAISFTDKGECIYGEDGEIVLGKNSHEKVLKRCDECKKIRWVQYRSIVMYDNDRYCGSCSKIINNDKKGMFRGYKVEDVVICGKENIIKHIKCNIPLEELLSYSANGEINVSLSGYCDYLYKERKNDK